MPKRHLLTAVALLVAGLFPGARAMQAQEQGSKELAKGMFHNADKTGKGMVTIYETADGKRMLRLSNFETDKGPDLWVRFLASDDAKDTSSVAKAAYIDVAKLTSNKGDQSYAVPESVDLAKYRVVSIWCKKFGVNFAAAPLKEAEAK